MGHLWKGLWRQKCGQYFEPETSLFRDRGRKRERERGTERGGIYGIHKLHI